MKDNDYHKKVVKIISQNLEIDLQQPFKLKKSSVGICTGFFIAKDLILTCAHCVLQSKDIFFEIPILGEKKYRLELLGVCPDFDIALLKPLKYQSKTYFKLGTKAHIKAGNEVYAIGFPLGQSNIKITRGIISGIQYKSIQIDAPLNPGNSGGPLIYKGKIIGINKSGYQKSNNVGYASPIFNYTTIKKELLDKKKILIQRPELGFEYNNCNQNMLLVKKSPKEGVFITNIFSKAPIEESKITSNDILTKINSSIIDNYGLIKSEITDYDKVPFTGLFDSLKLGDKVKIEYYRDGKLHKKNFHFTDFELPIKYIYPRFEKIEYEILNGIIFMDFYINHLILVKQKKFPPSLLTYVEDTDRTKPKIIISYIYPNTNISNIDVLEEADFITHVNNIEVDTIRKFRKAITKFIIVKKKKFIIIRTENNKEVAINVDEMLRKENNLANTFKYPISELYDKIREYNKK